MTRRTLVLFAKPPLMGRAKTRLARDVGPARAAGFYRASVGSLLHRLGGDPRWQMVLAVNADAGERYACWPSGVSRVRQGDGSLGDRMRRVLGGLPPGPAIVLGTDSPQVTPALVARGFRALGGADAVFGPAEDGGYWLVGLARRRPAPNLFTGVRWSTGDALADTRASLPGRFAVSTLPVLSDVDTGEDLSRFLSAYGAPRRGPVTERA